MFRTQQLHTTSTNCSITIIVTCSNASATQNRSSSKKFQRATNNNLRSTFIIINTNSNVHYHANPATHHHQNHKQQHHSETKSEREREFASEMTKKKSGGVKTVDAFASKKENESETEPPMKS